MGAASVGGGVCVYMHAGYMCGCVCLCAHICVSGGEEVAEIKSQRIGK